MSNRRNVRRKRALDDDEVEDTPEEMSLRDRLEATKDLQKSRVRSQGMPTENLAGSAKDIKASQSNDEEVIGGYVKEQKKEGGVQLDAEKEQFIREQLDKRLGRSNQEAEASQSNSRDYRDDLYAIPKALQAQKVEQEDVSAWMTGIVEVPLTVAQQMRNIEATEKAKKVLLNERESLDASVSNEAKPNELRRVTYPLRFGKQTNKEEVWRQEVLQRKPEPKDWTRRKQKP